MSDNRSGDRRATAITALALFVAFAAVAPEAAAITEAEVRERIAATYGVRVLKIRPDEIDGRAVYLVTVMRPGGNANDAFLVATLAVDRATGALVPTFDRRAGGVESSAAPAGLSAPQPLDAGQRKQGGP